MSNESAVATQTAIHSAFADDEDYAELLEMFAETLPKKRQQLQELHAKGDFDELAKFAHQLKGAGGGYGFQGMTDIARELELDCRAEETNRVQTRVETLLDYLDRIVV